MALDASSTDVTLRERSLAARIPKIHLHCHLEGSLRPSSFVELAASHGVPLRYRPPGSPETGSPVDPADPYRFTAFEEFLYAFAAVSRSLQQPEDYARLAREFVEDALAENVIYGELFVSPSVWTFFNPELDVAETFEAIVHELRAARPRARFSLLPDLTRNFGEASALQTAQVVAAMTDFDIIGVSLGGHETKFPARLFTEAFAFARAQGLRRVVHAGEADGAQSVRDAVELLAAERIGHGIRALEHPETVELLATLRIPLEICPTSNRVTGVALPEHPHPYVEFDRAGCIVTIDADDPSMLQTSIAQEYAIVERVAGPVALERFVHNAIDASFAGFDLRQAMHRRVTEGCAEPGVPSRG